MSRIHQALQRSRGVSDSTTPPPASDSDDRDGLEVFTGSTDRVVAPWRFGERARTKDPGRSDEEAAPASAPVKPTPPEVAQTTPSLSRRFRHLGLLGALAAVASVAALLASGALAPGGDTPQRLTGVVVANRVVVSAKAAGRIEQLLVEEGTLVEAGDLLAVLDSEEMDAEREREMALVTQLSARLRQARELATLEGDRGRGAVAAAEAELQVARSERAAAAAGVEQLWKDAERASQLFADGLVSRQEVERTDTEARSAEARARALSGRVRQAEANLDLARANEAQAGVARRDVEQTRAQLDQARAQVTQVDARLAEAEIRAPLDGVVSVRVAREGEVVRAGDPIVMLVDPDDVWVRAEVEESLVGRIAVGQTLEVELASGERLTGRLTFVEPEANFATQRDVSRVKRDIRTFGIKVAVPNPRRHVHHGMTAYVELPAASVAAGVR